MTLNIPIKPILNKNLPIKEGSNQVILCNSNRNAKDFLKSLKLRVNGKYEKIPNYFIEKNGKVHTLNKKDVTKLYFKGYHDSGVIVVCLENVGWLTRRSSDGRYVDWLGDIYNSKVHEKKWRGKLFWDEYSSVQINETAKLIKEVCNKNDIPNNFIGHNVLVEGIENFRGVTSRSNYSEYWTDINPSFNFNVL